MQLKPKRFDLDQKTRKFATCPLLPDPRTRSNTCASGRGRRATRGAATSRHVWLMAAAVAGPTRRGQATCAAVLAQPRARLRAPLFASSSSPRARVRRRGRATREPLSAWPGYMCCRACTAESSAPRSTVHLKRIPEGPCAKARRRHGAHRRHGALGARRPSSAALRVNDPRTVSKVVSPRPPRTPRRCLWRWRSQPRASTAGKSSSLERRGRANVQVRAAELLAFLLTEQHYRWCNCMC